MLRSGKVLCFNLFNFSSLTTWLTALAERCSFLTAMKKLTKAMCWELISKTKDRVNAVGVAVYRKPMDNECYEQRSEDAPPLCQGSDDPNAAWYCSQRDSNFFFSIIVK